MALGRTKGYGRVRRDYYRPHGRPKELWFSFRTHGSIEAKSHARRDQSFQEDSCQVRNHNAARVLGAFRQMAIFLCEMNAHRVRLKKDKRCLPELFRYASFNGIAHVLSWFLRPKAFKT